MQLDDSPLTINLAKCVIIQLHFIIAAYYNILIISTFNVRLSLRQTAFSKQKLS